MNQEPLSQGVNHLITKTQENLKREPNALDDHLKGLLGIAQTAEKPETMAALIAVGGTNFSVLLSGFLHIGIKAVVGDAKFDELANALHNEFEAFKAGRAAGQIGMN